MHEHSFSKGILRNIKNKDNVKKITIEVGTLAGIEPLHLKKHIMDICPGWDVEVFEKESKVRCECGFKGSAKILEKLHDLVIFECPKCGEVPEVLDGGNIKIIKIAYND